MNDEYIQILLLLLILILYVPNLLTHTTVNLDGVRAYCLLIHDRIVEYTPLTREVKKLV